MLVIIKSAPNTPDGNRGLRIARDASADVVLLQNGVYFAVNDMLDGFCGIAYAVEEDLRMRGLTAITGGIKTIDWSELIDLIFEEDSVIGLF